MADRLAAVAAIARALIRGLVVQTEVFSVDNEKVIHWTDAGGEILIQGYDSFDMACFFIDILGCEQALIAANEALDGTAPTFERPEIIHYSNPNELFDESSIPESPPKTSNSPPSTLRNYQHPH